MIMRTKEKCKKNTTVRVVRIKAKCGKEDQVRKLQNECYRYMAGFAEKIYQNEERREDSLLQQASNMQAAFSFVIAAVFMVASIAVEYRGKVPLSFMLMAFASITVVLSFSLFAATMAQRRAKREDYPKVSSIKKLIIDEYYNFKTPAQRDKYFVDTYEKMHASYEKVNEKRRKWVVVSMGSFYVALSLCMLWFIAAICLLIWG